VLAAYAVKLCVTNWSLLYCIVSGVTSRDCHRHSYSRL